MKWTMAICVARTGHTGATVISGCCRWSKSEFKFIDIECPKFKHLKHFFFVVRTNEIGNEILFLLISFPLPNDDFVPMAALTKTKNSTIINRSKCSSNVV